MLSDDRQLVRAVSGPSTDDKVRKAFADIEDWRARGQDLSRPTPGSPLEADDAVFTPHPIGEIARVSLTAAGEHLRLATTAIEAGQFFPTAHFTALRSALAGAAQAVWILAAPDAATRQKRGLLLIGEMYDQMTVYLNEQAKKPIRKEVAAALPSEMQLVKDRRSEVAAILSPTAEFSQTTTIEVAIDFCFSNSNRRKEGRVLWRELSGDAHVLGWSSFRRGTLVHQLDNSHLRVGETGTDIEEFVRPFLMIHEMIARGWTLRDELSQAQS